MDVVVLPIGAVPATRPKHHVTTSLPSAFRRVALARDPHLIVIGEPPVRFPSQGHCLPIHSFTMYARRGGSRGGFRGASTAKKPFTKKRAEPDDDDSTPRASKKAKDEADDEPLVPRLETDDNKDTFISVRGRNSTIGMKAKVRG